MCAFCVDKLLWIAHELLSVGGSRTKCTSYPDKNELPQMFFKYVSGMLLFAISNLLVRCFFFFSLLLLPFSLPCRVWNKSNVNVGDFWQSSWDSFNKNPAHVRVEKKNTATTVVTTERSKISHGNICMSTFILPVSKVSDSTTEKLLNVKACELKFWRSSTRSKCK